MAYLQGPSLFLFAFLLEIKPLRPRFGASSSPNEGSLIEEEEIHQKELELKEQMKNLSNQKEDLEKEKTQLELDRLKYESDKEELTTSLVKFNELVGNFSSGIDKFNKYGD